MRRLAWMIVLSTAAAACGFGSGGITRADAIAAAQREAPDSTGVVSASVGPISKFETGQQVVPGSTKVWAVTLSGRFPFSCGPAPAPGMTKECPAPATYETVLLDFRTGDFLLSFAKGP